MVTILHDQPSRAKWRLCLLLCLYDLLTLSAHTLVFSAAWRRWQGESTLVRSFRQGCCFRDGCPARPSFVSATFCSSFSSNRIAWLFPKATAFENLLLFSPRFSCFSMACLKSTLSRKRPLYSQIVTLYNRRQFQTSLLKNLLA